MEKSGSFSQNERIARGQNTATRTDFNAGLRQQMAADDVHYHAEKLGLGSHGTHEGWIKAEEANAASKVAVCAEERHEMISLAAYYLAEKRDFAEHGAYRDWMQAEVEVDAMLHGRI